MQQALFRVSGMVILITVAGLARKRTEISNWMSFVCNLSACGWLWIFEGAGMSELTDEQLASDAAKGDQNAFAELYERYKASAVGFAHSFLRCRSLAEDAAQDALISVYLNVRQFNAEKGSFKSWFFAILYHRCRRETRRGLWHWRRSGGTEEMAEMNENTPRYRLDIDTGIDIRTALEQLPRKHRTAVILTRIHGLSVRESARVLGISENNVKQRVFRGIADLRNMLGKGTSIRGAK